MSQVLHITPHLGGGVGRALAGVASSHKASHSVWNHEFVCLEVPEKDFALQELRDHGCTVHIAPDDRLLVELVAAADVVQVEWWHHPVLFQRLCAMSWPPMRLLVWCHINGLHTPLLPEKLHTAALKMIPTSPATLHCNAGETIHSCAGFPHIPVMKRSSSDPMSCGYLGSLNFAKLNPDFVQFLTAVKRNDFSVQLFGDDLNLETMQRQAEDFHRPELLKFQGWAESPAEALAGFNVSPYLLNPCHYGTTENALLETMAAGIVPVVLNHPVERTLVKDQVTGLVVSTAHEFGRAMEMLHRNPNLRQELGCAAAEYIRGKFTAEKTARLFDHHLNEMMGQSREIIDFPAAMGLTPVQYFLSGQEFPEIFLQNLPLPATGSPHRPGFHENSKGSIFHFQRYFPDDSDLKKWAHRLQRNTMPFFSCPVCGQANDQTLLNLETGNLDGSTLYPEVRLVCCESCGHVYNNITQAELTGLYQYYNEEYALINLKASASKGDRPGSDDGLTANRYDQMFGYVENHLQPDHRILDVGCAVGGFLTYLQAKGFSDLTGVDMTDNYVRQARERTEFRIELGQAEDLPFEDSSFDFLVLEQVMEHLINPGRAFREAGRVLAPGGILCIGVPDAANYDQRHFFDYYWLLLREHIQHFDINHLQQLAHGCSFELLDFHQTDHAVMSDKMIMPTLYSIFRWPGKEPRTMEAEGCADDLRAGITTHLANQAALLEQRRNLVKRLEESGQPVFVWGVGREFEYLLAAAGLNRCNLRGLVDLNKLKQSQHTVGGMAVQGPGILKEASDNAVLLVTAVAHTDSITEAARALGFKGEIVNFTKES